MRRLVVAPAFALGMVLGLTGCGLAAQNVPLPGQGVDGETYRLSATFSDALNLTEGAPVKLNGATVGQVKGVRAEDYTAQVDMVVQVAARLHGGASARLRGTTPLGELYVQLDDGTSPSLLPDGATLSEGTVAPTIEDTMATTSLFLNGGGISALGTILRESNTALSGREDNARDVLERLDRTIAELEASTDDLDAALTSLSRLSTSLNQQRSTIRMALRDVGPTARAVRSQVEDLAKLLSHIEEFSGMTSSVIDAVQADLVRSLQQMGPIFEQMNGIEDDLTPAIQELVAFSKALDKAVPTRNLNTDLHIHINELPTLPLGAGDAKAKTPAGSAGPKQGGSATGAPPGLRVPVLPDVQKLVDPKPLIDTLNGLLSGLQPKAQR